MFNHSVYISFPKFRGPVTMAMCLILTMLYITICLASGVTTLQNGTGDVTVPEKSARRELLGSHASMRRELLGSHASMRRELLGSHASMRLELMGSLYAKMRRLTEFSKNILTILKSGQTYRYPGLSDENISDSTKTSPSQVGSLNLDKSKDINENKNTFSVPILSLKDKKSETTITSNDISERSPFDFKLYARNTFPKENASLNTSGERARQIPDQQTRKIGRQLRHARERADTHSESNEALLNLDFTSVPRNPLIGHTHNTLTLKAPDDYSGHECTCKSTKCDCSHLGLTEIPQNLDTTITELLLNYNPLKKLLKNVLSRYQMLERLVLTYCIIETLEYGAFEGLTRLVYLDLSLNIFMNTVYIPERIFEPLKSLKILMLYSDTNGNLCFLNCSFVYRALAYLHSVEELNIDYIGQDEFGPEFTNMTSLRKLTVSCTEYKISSFSNETFQHLDHITALNIMSCGINGSTITASTFLPLRRLLTLDISHNPHIGMNNLPVILESLRDSNLQTLNMSYIVSDYAITKVNKSLTQLLPRRLTTLVAIGNNILSIDRDAVRYLPKSLKTIDISGNNIIVDPNNIPLDELVGLETLFIHSGNDECVNDYEEHTVQSLCDHLGFQEFKGTQEGELLEKEISAKKWGNKIVLPGRLKSVKMNVQNMHAFFLHSVDERNNIEVLDLSCSYLSQFSVNSFFNFPKLRCLNVRKSSVRKIFTPYWGMDTLKVLILESNMLNDFVTAQNTFLSDLVNLSYLDLSLNQLNYLRQDLFIGLDNLEYLRLDRNSFSYFGADISNMTQLKLLNLSNTELSQLPRDARAHIDQLCKVKPGGQVRVDMAGCPIQCDCFNLDFLKWMVISTAFDNNFTGYKCRYPDTSLKYILDGYQETIAVLDRECAKNYPMFLIVLAATSVLVCAVVGAVVYRLRWNIRYLYYAAYLKIMDKRQNDKQYQFTYDVFISYDSEDQGFVTRHLSPELEKRGLKLLVHTRDFVAGTYIASNIVMAVAESRKTLVVLTRNLLESSWCNYELQMATMEAVHTGRQVLVFLLKENIPSSELEVDLLRHIRSNTYVPYPGPEEEGDEDVMGRFYDKLAHDLRC